ncbi:MAG: PTS sugar transporter subunit IIA [Candidatus Anstonellales archaeon]
MKILTFTVNGSWKDALSTLSDRLLKLNYVMGDYKKSLLEREQSHPTGLVLENSINVAIPHTDPELVKENAFVIGIPKSDIRFRRIDDPSSEIIVDLIFLLVIKDPDKYLKFLSLLTENFLNPQFLSYIRNKDVNNIEMFLRHKILNIVST